MNPVAHMLDDTRAMGGESLDVGGIGKTPARGDPARDGEMAERDDRLHLAAFAGFENAPVIGEAGVGNLPALGFDPRPFDPEAMGVEAERGRQRDVFVEAVIDVAGVARLVRENRRHDMFHDPQVAGDVRALDLISGAGRAPQEPGAPFAGCGRRRSGHQHRPCRAAGHAQKVTTFHIFSTYGQFRL
jgi:hypothetical protein